MKTLPFSMPLRDYQERFFVDAHKHLDGDGECDPTGGGILYASPTGTGKSVMELTLLAWHPGAVLVTPRLEIVAGMLQKGGIDASGWTDEKLAAEALEYRITTPIRFRNMLAKGTLPWRPDCVIWDEAHHRSADSYADIRAYLGAGTAEIGLTASPFRGTPKGTQEFLDSWQSLTWVMTYPGAAAAGVLAVPTCTVWPLVDDDELEVTNGEITVRSASDAVTDQLDEVVERCRGYQRRRFTGSSGITTGMIDPRSYRWDRPTIFAVPSTACCIELATRLTLTGLPAAPVTQDTPRAERNRIFAACCRGELAIVQIDVVSEGVDLPQLRRCVDLRPTLSPVKWLQQVGRITRPGNPAPEYICCNRNLERHCYLFEGLIPPQTVAAAQQAFQKPSRRAGVRVLGMENLGRFTPAELPLADGTTGMMYNLTAVEGFTRKEYAILLHPCASQPLYAARESHGTGNGSVTWGKWRVVPSIPDVRGFGSAPAKSLSERQQAWWSKAAGNYGLDKNAAANRRNFAALPILSDTGVRLTGGAA